MFWISTILIIILLIAANAFYVTAEFATVSSRASRLSNLSENGNKTAQFLLEIVQDPKKLDAYVATCQVGITISSLILGFYGQAQLSDLITPFLENIGLGSAVAVESISAAVVLVFLSIFQILLGELIPKNVAMQYPERLAMLTAKLMQWSNIIFRPLIWVFNGSGIALMRILKISPSEEHGHIHSPEELLLLVNESGAGGVLKDEEHRLLNNILQMSQASVKQIMIPRTRMLTAPSTIELPALLKLLADSPYSRIPIYREKIDNIIGIIHLRDLLQIQQADNQSTLFEVLHSVPFVPATMLVKDVFSLLQNKHFQMAIVMDEFGGTAGMVTLEDLLEQIFGDLQDEFDTSIPLFRATANERLWIRGDIQIGVVNEVLDLKLPTDDSETIGGLILNEIGHVPILNEEIDILSKKFRVEKMTGRGIAMISMASTKEQIKNAKEYLD